MPTLALDELKTILYDVAGDGEEPISPDNLDVAYGDLGYDSLSVMELSVQLKRRYQVVLPEELVTPELTPRRTLALVNEARQGVA